MRYFRGSSLAAARVLSLGVLLGALPQTSSAETRWYAIGMQHLATYTDGKKGPGANCPTGGNPQWIGEQVRILQFRYHYTEAQARKILADFDYGKPDPVASRGLKDGKPAPILEYPTSIPKKPDEIIVDHGKAYGFDLDGKAATRKDALIDPETHQPVENNLYKALGCYALYKINLPDRPVYEESVYIDALAEMPAWLMSVTGADLSKDGPVTITFARALQHPLTGADSKPLRGQTFTLDPSNRSFGTLPGKIVAGELTAQGGEIQLEGETPELTVWNMTNTHLRLKINPDGSLGGYIGGFQPWMDYWFLQTALESDDGADLSTVYYNLRDMADADPDPVTHRNRRISATYRLDDLEPVSVLPAPDNYQAPVDLRARNLQAISRYVRGAGYGSADAQIARR
jgi:hypothetical protein